MRQFAACCGVCAAAVAAGQPANETHDLSSAGDAGFVQAAVILPGVVTSIAQDRLGFIWLGTGSGLFRWDGYRSTNPAAADPAHTAWSLGRINALAMDGQGRLWVATDHGLVRRERGSTGFITLQQTENELDIPTALHADNVGGMWVGTQRGVMHLNAAGAQPLPSMPGLPAERINALLLDRAGSLWVGTGRGLFRLPKGGRTFAAFPLVRKPGAAEPTILALAQDAAGRIWACGSQAGAYVLDASGQVATPLAGVQAVGGAEADLVNSLVEARHGEMWLGLSHRGMLRLEIDSGRHRLEQRDARRRMSLPGNEVRSIVRGNDGRIWISTEGGVVHHDPDSRVLQTLVGGAAPWQLLSEEVWSVMQDQDGRVWLGDHDGGIEFLDARFRSTGRLQVLPHGGLPGARRALRHLAQAPDGTVWVATEQGVFRVDAQGRLAQRPVSSDKGLSLSARRLAWIGKVLYVGGTDALRRYRINRQGVAELERRWPLEHGVSFLQGSTDRAAVHVGTTMGLWRLDTASGRLLAVEPVPRGRNPKGYIASILPLPQDRLWVAGFGRGIAVESPPMAGSAPSFRRLGMREGLLHDSVNCMLPDASGAVWASTDDGMVRIQPANLSIRAFHRFRHQGLGQPTFWAGACASTRAGELLFGGTSGLTVVRPKALAASHPPGAPSQPVITEISIDGALWQPPGGGAAGKLALPAGARMLGVEFAALGVDDPESQQYSYRLLGFEQAWIETPASRRLASYTNLPAGTYRLQLRTRMAGGSWSAPAELPVEMAPAWFERDGVRVLLAALALAGLVGFVQLRTLYLRRSAGELSRQVQGRTRELRHSEEAFRKLAYFDNVTGLPNRNHLMESLQAGIEFTRAKRATLGVLFIDLDRFKWVNDSFGHAVGDQLLRLVAERLNQGIVDMRAVADASAALPALVTGTHVAGLVTRFGGDEYVVVLPALPCEEAAIEMANRLQRRFGQPFELDTGAIFCGASIGVSTFPEDGEVPDALLVRADMAMYQAKLDGRNRVVRYSPALDGRSRRRSEIAGKVASAREEGRLRLHCQPIVNLLSGDVVGYEALMRMVDPGDGSLISPSEFIPVAEELGVIHSTGLWAIERVLHMLRDWPQAHPLWPAPRYISVNVSPLQLVDADFPIQVRRLLDDSGVDSRRLVLEMTESCLMDASDRNLSCIRRLHALGLSLSIDDFGTGYSSLSSLKNFPFSVLKIDGVFVRDLATDPSSRQMVAAIIAMAAVYDLSIVTEGVENEAQASVLRELQPHGTLCAQGHLYGRPAEVAATA